MHQVDLELNAKTSTIAEMNKQFYYTQKSIQEKSREMLGAVDNRQRQEFQFRPQSAVLLVLDMQEYFLDGNSHAFVPSAPAIQSGIQALMIAFHRIKRPVVCTRHINTPKNAGMMSKWWRDLIKPRDAHRQIVSQLDMPNNINITKTQYDAFYHTSLESTLRKFDIDQVVICGVMTHLCCETTARSAFMRGFEVYFTIDGTATYNEALQRASLLTLSHGFAIPVLINEILSQLDIHAP